VITSDPPDEATFRAAEQIAERITDLWPHIEVVSFASTTGPFVVVELHAPLPEERPVVVTLFHDGSFQIEVYHLLEIGHELPLPFEEAVELAMAEIIEVVSSGAQGYGPWPRARSGRADP
jgi:hypothetical protein